MSTLDPDLQALQEVRDFAERAWRACEAVHGTTQEQIDRVCQAMAEAGAETFLNECSACHGENGEGLPDKGSALAGTELTEQDFLDLEREVFVELFVCGPDLVVFHLTRAGLGVERLTRGAPAPPRGSAAAHRHGRGAHAGHL